MSEPVGIQENDVVVTKVVSQYWVWQQVGKSRKRLDGPYDDLVQAESFWRKRQPPDQRTGADLLGFYNRFEANRPELLKRGYGDPYQTAKSRSEWPR